MATSNNSVIISRIQNRRGLKQDLPQPLREGEIGFATDSKQVYIGGSLSDSSSNISIFETTSGAESFTKSIANSRIIAFTVPHKRFPKNISFDGISKTKLWNITDATYTGSGLTVFNDSITSTPVASVLANTANTIHTLNTSNSYISAGDIVTGNDIIGNVSVVSFDTISKTLVLSSNQSLTTANALTFTPNNIKSIMTNEAFKSSGLTVFKNNERLVGDDVNITPSASKDYSFNSTSLGSNTHTLNFRVAPLQTDTISINYYGNTAVTKALSNTNTVFVGTSTQSFYDQYSVPSYRQLSNSLIKVSETSGKGFIGLQFKHLAVYQDSVTISSPSSLSLGSLLASRNDMKSASEVNVSQSGATVTVSAGSLNQFSNTGTYDYIFFSDAGNSWIDGKALPVANVQSSSLEVTLPTGNSWQTARAVTTTASGVGDVVTVTGNIEGLSNGDNVSFNGANVSNFSGIYPVTNITSNSFDVVQANISITSGDLNYVNHGANTDIKNVQIISSEHGQPANSIIEFYGSSSTGEINNTNFTVQDSVITTNTFFLTATGNITANVTGSSNVLVTESTANYTPTISYDLSSFTTLPEVIANVSNGVGFLDISYIPSFTNKIYVSTKPSLDSVTATDGGSAIEFRLHNDSSDTLGTLGLTAGNKTKQNNTVKARLETWLNGLVVDKTVNLFTSVDVSDKYSVGTNNLGTFNLNLQTRTSDNVRYMQFDTREEAQAFNSILNNIYFSTVSSEIRGLVNIETNIELLTSETAGGGAKVTTYDDTEDDVITNSGSLQSLSKTIDTADYDSFIVDYTVKYDGTTDGNYRRIGTMYLNVFNNTDTSNSGIIFQDIASDLADTLTGNVTFSADFDAGNTDITLKAVNTTGKNLSMNYITRRWSS